MKWSAQVPQCCWPPGKTKTLCASCNLVDTTASVFKNVLKIRYRRAFWMAESEGIMFSPLNNVKLLLKPENLENKIRRNLIFSGAAGWSKKLAIFNWKDEKRGDIA